MHQSKVFHRAAVMALCVLLATGVATAGQAPGGPATENRGPGTKIETLLLSKGTLLNKDFYPLGRLAGAIGGGTADLDALVVSSPGRTNIQLKGLRIEVKEGGRLERSTTAFLDLEEIDDLLRAIEFFASPQSHDQPKPQTSGVASNREAHRETTFSTKGDFSLTCLGKTGDRTCVLQSGRIGAVNLFIREEIQLDQLKTMVTNARTILQNQ